MAERARDRVGLLWRSGLAEALCKSLHAVDLIQVITEDWIDASAVELRALRSLGVDVPLHLHGVSLGLASAHATCEKRLGRVARVIHAVEPERWSEHLAFVRAGGLELGHLATPPRTQASLDGAVKNVEHAARTIGSLPELENVATLFDPPGSRISEARWTAEIVRSSGAGLLLDLHNLHTNAVNLGLCPLAYLSEAPIERTVIVHIAGGSWQQLRLGVERRVDDHRHAVPPVVFTLLEELAARVAQPLDVILEREGRCPPLRVLCAELARAREALAAGRERRALAAGRERRALAAGRERRALAAGRERRALAAGRAACIASPERAP